MHTTCKDKRRLEKFFQAYIEKNISGLLVLKCLVTTEGGRVCLSHALWYYNNFQAISVPSTVLLQDMTNFYLAQ